MSAKASLGLLTLILANELTHVFADLVDVQVGQ
jgi:hypothetical protein